ncbi:MAG: 5-(carboxyamino)imidazole ribonucleotide synthase [Ignavibacteria bacterium]|jgi:5-(carboxyamino)imidazole ribonucleotide synthase|nr:5-(carboxyamino)imidazole ribonucleotide synthase [Ignavibacteria bacterium]
MTLGILGGGQLAKMLANEAYRLGLNIAIIDNGDNTPAGDMTKNNFTAGWNSRAELDKFIGVSDVITLENEFISPDILAYIATLKPVYPSAETLRLVQDKFIQKNTFAKNNIPLPGYAAIDSIADLNQFGSQYDYPFIIKTRTLGYDGYGNYKVENENDCEVGWNKFNSDGKNRELMAEEFIDFEKEVAVMVTRNKCGEVAVYPCVETIQRNHICHQVIAPAQIDIDLAFIAQETAVKAVEAIDGVGVFGVEMFVTTAKSILVNEIAPRPHNSGHYTIEGCYCSQYENAIRAIFDLPLGSTEMVKPAACMINLLGTRNGIGVPENISSTLKETHTKLHLYNKKECRIGRKMGHITTIADTIENAIKEATNAYNHFVW